MSARRVTWALTASFLVSCFAIACNESRTPTEHGAPCGPDVPCGGDLLCVSSGAFPGGYCSSVCDSAPCASGAICDRSMAPALCLAVCSGDDECRDGYQCWDGACRPGCDVAPAVCGEGARCTDGRCEELECTRDEDCGPGRRCAASACVAILDSGVPLLADGEPCASDGECATGICLPASRGGVCSNACSEPTECLSAVTFDASCAPVPRGGTIQTLCVPYAPGARAGEPCASDAQCERATCVGGQCTGVCEDEGDCLRGQVCRDVAWGGGVFRGCGFPAGTDTYEIELGTHDLRAGFGTSALEFATPPGSIGVTLRARTVSGDPLPLSFFDVVDPAGTTIFDLEEIYAWRDPPVRWIPLDTEEAIAMLVPNATSERLTYVPGRHAVRVFAMSRTMGDTGSVRVEVDALVRRASGAVTSGVIDLDVYLVGVGVTAGAAPGNARVQAALSRFRTLMMQVGVTTGDVAYHDVSSDDATRYQVIDSTDGPASELAGMFRLSAGIAGNRLAIFLVRSVNGGGDGFNTLGIAGGIPGPSGIHGTAHSGVVVAFDSSVVGASGTLAGHVMAHEVGHFLGLYHVTERVRACGPGEEPSASCAPFGSTDTIGDTTRGDTANLMHWSLVGGGDNDDLSAGQGFVILRSALVR